MIIGVNASRARSGGAIAHLVGIISEISPLLGGFEEIHVWSYAELLRALPERPWLVKHGPSPLRKNLWRQVLWERLELQKELRKHKCAIVVNVDAGTVCRFRPAVTISQDMLSYEAGEMVRFGFGRARARLLALRHVQNASLRRADGVIFLTRYAATAIQAVTGRLANTTVIPHGVGDEFRSSKGHQQLQGEPKRQLCCVYVSNTAPYKHQWKVVEAIAALRRDGYDLRLELVGGGSGLAQARLDEEIARRDPDGMFVKQIGFVAHKALPQVLSRADMFLFASSCENLPVTLIEGMAAGLPIACSNRGPMPEVLQDAGVYFDPENAVSIASAVQRLLVQPELRARLAKRALELAAAYSWYQCAMDTFAFVRRTVQATRE
jgi:glycosyltransferase involved in cell wall biosynthesis